MYIIAIGWAYVILMMAVTSSSLIKGLMVALFLGVLPLWLFIYVAGASRRRSMADQPTDAPHRKNTESDQD
ncbi:MAG: hypothetical protein ABL892_03740 [Thiobacillaceae bacterium]